MAALERAREHLAACADAAWAAFLGDFSVLYSPFSAAVAALAQLDVLQSLAVVALNPGYVLCGSVGVALLCVRAPDDMR